MSSESKVAKASFWYMVSNFLLRGIGFITTPIFARLLTMEEYGRYNNFTTALSILTIIATLSLSASLISARTDFKSDLNNYVGNILIIGSISVGVVFAVLILLNKWVSEIVKLDFKYIILMCLVMLFSPAYDIFMNLQRFEYKYKKVVFLTFLVSAVSVLLSLFLMYGSSDHLWARVLGANIPLLAISMAMFFYYILRIRGISKKYIKYSLAICVPYVFHSLSGTILNSSDRLMITYISGEKYTAIYSMGGNISLIVSVLWSSMNTAYIPWLADKLELKEHTKIRKFSYIYVIAFVYIAIGLMLVAPEALLIMGGKRYLTAQYTIPPIMLGYVFVFLYSMYALVEQIKKQTIGMAIATTAAAFINVFLNYICIHKFGFIAAAYTTVISYFFLFVLHYIIVRHMGYSSIYDSRFVIGVSLSVTLISFFVIILYSYILYRYVFLFGYTVIGVVALFRYRKDIIRIIGNKK